VVSPSTVDEHVRTVPADLAVAGRRLRLGARIIPLDGRPHAGQNMRSYMGDARGRWDGDTLVVETTNFRDEAAYRGANAATLRLTERFTRLDSDTMKYEATIDDPKVFTRSWKIRSAGSSTRSRPSTRNIPSRTCGGYWPTSTGSNRRISRA